MKVIKADQYLEKPTILMSDWIAQTVKQYLDRLPFASFFKENTVLVPIPGSSLMQANSLWVPHRIATALVNTGIGKEVVACLVRKTPVRKSAWSKTSERPTVKEHIASFSLQELIKYVGKIDAKRLPNNPNQKPNPKFLELLRKNS